MAYETVSDLIKAFRDEEKDLVEPYFWSDAQLVRFINGALTAFCERSKSVISEIEVDVSAGESVADYPPYIIDVLDASLEAGGRVSDLQVKGPGDIRRSQMRGSGRPHTLVADTGLGQMRLVPTPSASGVALLTVIRRPIKELAKDGKLSDIKPAHREALLLYVKHRAYNVKDAELFDGVRAGAYLAEFNYECQRAYEDDLRRRGGARKIRYGG